MRMFPLLALHMRDADWVGRPAPAGWLFVAHSEHEGGIERWDGFSTGPKFITPGFQTETAGRKRLTPRPGDTPLLS
jgi:hypothetical protein